MKSGQVLQVTAIAAVMGAFAATSVLAESNSARIRNCPDSDWCHYHRTVDKGWRHTPLAQINAGNVSELRPAWIFQPGHERMGLHSTPLAVDGAVYLATNPSTVWKMVSSRILAVAILTLLICPAAEVTHPTPAVSPPSNWTPSRRCTAARS